MEKGVFIFLLLELTVVLSSPISFDFNIIGKQGSNLISFSENPSLSIQYDNQAVLGEFCFGSDNQCFDMQIDMNSLTTWVADSENKQSSINRFNKKRSETCQIGKEVEIEYEDGRKISGYNVQDKLKIGDTSIDSFSFISAVDSKDFSDINGMISLGCSGGGSDEKYSLLSQLADKGIIKHKVVTVEFVKQTKGTLTIGKLPPEAISDYKNYGTCDIESEKTVDKITTTVDRPWYCNVKGLIIGRDPKRDTVYDFAVKKGKFDLTTNKTFLPLTYLLKMNKEYFSNLMSAGECNFGFKEGYYTFTCIKDNYDLPAITIMFEKWGIYIPKEDLFTYDSNDEEYEFIFYGKEGNDGFVIGTDIMKHFVMVFDESNKNIGFYSPNQNNLVKLTDEPLSPPKSYDDSSSTPNPPIKPILTPDEPDKPKPLIPEEPGNNGEKRPILRPDSGENNNDKDPIRPPEIIDPNQGGARVIPEDEEGFFGKFLKTAGILFLILGVLFIGWLGLRFYRRKKYSDPTYYYKVTDEMFNEGTPLE